MLQCWTLNRHLQAVYRTFTIQKIPLEYGVVLIFPLCMAAIRVAATTNINLHLQLMTNVYIDDSSDHVLWPAIS